MTYRTFVAAFMRQRRPTTLAQGRAAMRDAAAAWREMKRLANPRRNKPRRLPARRAYARPARVLQFRRRKAATPRPPQRAANPAFLAVPAVELLAPAIGAALVLKRGHEALKKNPGRNPRCPSCARAIHVPAGATSGHCPHCRAGLRVKRG